MATDAMLGWLRGGWNPSGRPGTPADIEGAVAALCGEDAGWITGQTIVADGGASLMCPELPIDFSAQRGLILDPRPGELNHPGLARMLAMARAETTRACDSPLPPRLGPTSRGWQNIQSA